MQKDAKKEETHPLKREVSSFLLFASRSSEIGIIGERVDALVAPAKFKMDVITFVHIA